MNKDAKTEANHALVQAHNSYQLLLREGFKFELAKRQNKDILPMHMWAEWKQWREKIHEVDRQIERFYK